MDGPRGSVFRESRMFDPADHGNARSNTTVPRTSNLVLRVSTLEGDGCRVAGQLESLCTLTTYAADSESVTVFSTTDSWGAPAVTGRADVDFALIRDVQAYLQCLSESTPPTPRSCRAWERFYLLYSPFVRKIISNSLIPEDEADDCVQETWAEILCKLASFDPDPRRGRFLSWLSVVTRRKIIRFNQARARKRFTSMADADARILSRDMDPVDACLQRERREQVHEMLAAFDRTESTTSYQVMRYRSVDGLSSGVIADLLDITPEQVRARYHRMKRKAGRFLRSRFGGV